MISKTPAVIVPCGDGKPTTEIFTSALFPTEGSTMLGGLK
jgi:hypothetical protein